MMSQSHDDNDNRKMNHIIKVRYQVSCLVLVRFLIIIYIHYIIITGPGGGLELWTTTL